MAKTHMDDPESWKFKRNRHGDDHANNCTDGYIQPKGKDPNWLEIHHILCVHACSDDTFPADMTEDKKTFIYACFAITTWDINGADNNIGLPRKWAYVLDPDDNTGWDGYPCHQVDHDLYLTEVESWVRDNIWKKCNSASKKEKCELMKGEALAQMFDKGSSKWKTFLTKRGNSYGGTFNCLNYCLEDEVHAKLEGHEDQWHVPFSMAPDGQVRDRVKPPPQKKLQRLGLFAAAID